MAYRYDDLAPGEVYHVFTRGVDKQNIFRDDVDRKRWLGLLVHCLPVGVIQSYSLALRSKNEQKITESGVGLIDLMAYCLMNNHVHLLLKENHENGTSLYMQRLLNSYAKYFNVRHKRSGPLFTGRFKAVLVDEDDQLLHVSRYIHLNPYVAHMVKDPLGYQWSSLTDYVTEKSKPTCHTGLISELMDPAEYQKFVTDEADYAQANHDAEHLLFDFDD